MTRLVITAIVGLALSSPLAAQYRTDAELEQKLRARGFTEKTGPCWQQGPEKKNTFSRGDNQATFPFTWQCGMAKKLDVEYCVWRNQRGWQCGLTLHDKSKPLDILMPRNGRVRLFEREDSTIATPKRVRIQ
jgi:hypothetical protein